MRNTSPTILWLAVLLASACLAAPTTQPDEKARPRRVRVHVSDDGKLTPMERLAGPTTRPSTRRAPATQPDTTADLPLPERAPQRLKLGKYELAEKDFRELLKSKDTKVAAALGLAELYRRTGQYEQSSGMLAQIEAEAGGTAAWRCEKAELLAVRGKYEDALKLAEQVLAEDKRDLRARWLAGQQLETLGRIEQAKEVYKFADALTSKTPPADAPGKTYAGLILDRYSRLIAKPVTYGTRILQDLYQEAYEKVDRQYWPARVAAGYLSLAAYKTGQAAEDLVAALKINPKAYEANLGLGWAQLSRWRFEQVDRQLAAAKKVNPKDPGVLELEAALHMMERDYASAAKSAQAGLDVNPRHIGCLGHLAAAELRLGRRDRVAELTRRATAVNPKPAEFYRILAEWQSAARQFDSAERYYKQAIELAPWDPDPMTSLGMMYMQTGQEDHASAVLEKAFKIDRYNRRSYNTLTLLDQLVAFDTLESEHFVIKFNRSTEAILGPYFRDYLESIYAELCRDYDVQLPRKSIVEIFPTHAQFSVRTTGRPWIPTVGACTGWVVAMYSPRKMAGTRRGFNWSRVLRHEFTHVVTLAATGNRIPHWFTEGLAVSQEQHPRQWTWVRLLSGSLRRNQLFTVDKINWGFIRPRRRNDRQLAYAQSEWMVEFIIDHYGYKRINELLKAFRDYKTQPQALSDVLGVTEKEFDKLFREWARVQVKQEWRLPAEEIPTLAEAKKAVEKNKDDAAAQADLAVAYYYARRRADAEKAARAALAIDPNNAKALSVLGTLLAARKDKWSEAKDILLKLAEVDATAAAAPRLLARRALADGQMELAAFWFNRLKLASPLDPLSHTGLAGIYLLLDQKEKALAELAELARREQSDTRYALRLASLYTQLGKPDQAVHWLDQAMHIDPFNASIHEQLAVAYVDTQRPDQAIAEMKVAIQLKPDEASYWARLAFIYDANNRAALARRAAEFAVKLDPESPARDLLKSSPTTQPAVRGMPRPAQPASGTPLKPTPAFAPLPGDEID